MAAHQVKQYPSKTELYVWRCHVKILQSSQTTLWSHRLTMYETMVYFWTTLFLISTSPSLNRSYRFLLRRNQSFLSMEVTQVLVKSLVISKLDYCESLPSTSPATDPERTPSSSNPRSRSHCCVPSWLLIPIQHHTAFKTLELANWPLAIIRHLSNPTLNHVPFRL